MVTLCVLAVLAAVLGGVAGAWLGYRAARAEDQRETAFAGDGRRGKPAYLTRGAKAQTRAGPPDHPCGYRGGKTKMLGAVAEMARISAILRNIDAYNGSNKGQEEVMAIDGGQ